MSGHWLTTLMATLVVVAVAMLALGLGILLGRTGPGGSCGSPGCACEAARDACPSRPERP